MKKMSTSELSARINRFMDSRKAKPIDLSEISERKVQRGYRQQIDVMHSPFIALAIK